MASADFSQFVVTAADGTACETSRDKSSVFPRLPARFTRLGYGCLLDFAVLRQLIRQTRLISGFCSSGYDFAIPSSRLHLTVQTLGVALGFVGNYAPYGLSPQTDGMPVIHNKSRNGSSGFCHSKEKACEETDFRFFTRLLLLHGFCLCSFSISMRTVIRGFCHRSLPHRHGSSCTAS